MTVSTTNSVYSYDGDGSTVAFSFPRYAQSSAQIVAVVVDETTGAETSPSYTVSGSGSSWTVTFASAPASTTKVVVFRDPSVVQETSFASEGDPLAAMTAKADLLTMQLQALRNRALRMGDGTLQDFDPKLPNPTGAAGFAVVVNDAETGLSFGAALADGVVSSDWQPIINGTVANGAALIAAAYPFSITAASLAGLQALSAGQSEAVILRGRVNESDGGEGVFVWRSGDQSAKITADTLSGVWVAPASASSGASGAWERQAPPRTFRPEWYGAARDGSTNDAAAIQAAITAASVAGGTVLFGPYSYGVSSTLTVQADNVRLEGARGATKLVGLGSSNIDLVDVLGTAANSSTLGASVSKNDVTVQLASASSYSVGQYFAISATLTSPAAYAVKFISRIVGKSSNTLTLSEPFPFAVASSDTNTCYVVTAREGCSVSGITFDCGSNSGTTRGLGVLYANGFSETDCSFVGFSLSSCSLYQDCYRPSIVRRAQSDCGTSAAEGGLQFNNVCRAYVEDTYGVESSGFDFVFQFSCYGHFKGLTSTRAYGRAIKFGGSHRNMIVDCVALEAGVGAASLSGFAISIYSTENVLIGCEAYKNGENGFWFNNQHNTGNLLIGCVGSGNSPYDLRILTTDTDNQAIGCRFATAQDGSAASIIETLSSATRTISAQTQRLYWADNGASGAPFYETFRESASPAASDFLGGFTGSGRNSANAEKTYARMFSVIASPTSTAEGGAWYFDTLQSGAFAFELQISAGLLVGNATGGAKGVGTANFAGDIYKNNTAFANPDYVFEHFYDGRIERFAGNEGASAYVGLTPIEDLEAITRDTLRLPGMSDEASGAFARADKLLEKVEELTLYIIQLHKRIEALEG